MKIAMTVPAYAPSAGGVEKHVRAVVRELRSRGHDVNVLVRPVSTPDCESVVDGVPVLPLPRSLTVPAVASWLARHRWLWDVDVVHSHDVYVHALHRLLPRAHFVHTFHGFEAYPIPSEAITARQFIRSNVDATFGVGSFMNRWYGFEADEVLWGGVEPVTPMQQPRDLDLVAVARLEKDTGAEALVDALVRVDDRSRKVLILGDGSLRTALRERVDAAGLDVEIRSDVTDVVPLLQRAKFAYVSGYLAMAECASAGTPMISFYGNDLKSDYLLSHPLASCMHVADSVDGLVEALSTPSLVDGLDVERARSWSEQHSWTDLTDRYEDAYTQQGRHPMATTRSDGDQANRDLYAAFHENVPLITQVPSDDDWMYHFILRSLGRHLRPGMRVLDVGCGNGILSLFAANRGCRVLGIDISEAAVAGASKSAACNGLQDYASFECQLLQDCDPDLKADCVILSEVLEHLHDDIGALDAIRQRLVPGGMLFVTVPSPRSLSHRLRRRLVGVDRFDATVGHLRRYDMAQVTSLIESAGFEIVESRQGEGPFRNLILISERLGFLYRYLVRARANRVFEGLDRIAMKFLGEAQVIVVSRKPVPDVR